MQGKYTQKTKEWERRSEGDNLSQPTNLLHTLEEGRLKGRCGEVSGLGWQSRARGRELVGKLAWEADWPNTLTN